MAFRVTLNATANLAKAIRRLALPRTSDLLYVLEQTANAPACRSPRILRRTGIFLTVSGTLVATAAWTSNELDYHWWLKAVNAKSANDRSLPELAPMELRQKERVEGVLRFTRAVVARVPESLAGLVRYASLVPSRIAGMDDISQFCLLVTAVNLSVYALTWFPKGYIIAGTRLAHAGLSGKSYTMFTMPFVHFGILHLGVNTLGLIACYAGFLHLAEQDGPSSWTVSFPKQLAFYLIAGGFSCYVPTIWAATVHRRFLQSLPPTTKVFGVLPPEFPFGLRAVNGASGAIMAALTVTLMSKNITVDLGVVSITTHQAWAFSLVCDALIYGILGKFLSVAVPVHVAGVAFGLAYLYGGQMVWDWARTAVGNRKTRVRITTEEGSDEPFYIFSFEQPSPPEDSSHE